jgi:hypothetical protein
MTRDELLRVATHLHAGMLAYGDDNTGYWKPDAPETVALAVGAAAHLIAAVDAHLATTAPARCNWVAGGLRCEKPAGHDGHHFMAGLAGRDDPKPAQDFAAYCPTYDSLVRADGTRWDADGSDKWRMARAELHSRLLITPAKCSCPACDKDRAVPKPDDEAVRLLAKAYPWRNDEGECAWCLAPGCGATVAPCDRHARARAMTNGKR